MLSKTRLRPRSGTWTEAARFLLSTTDGRRQASPDRRPRGDERGQRPRSALEHGRPGQAAIGVESLDVLSDRATSQARKCWPARPWAVIPYVPRPLTSGARADGRFGKQDFVYISEQDVYRCPSDQLLPRHMTTVDKGLTLHRYWDRASCQACPQHAGDLWEGHSAVLQAFGVTESIMTSLPRKSWSAKVPPDGSTRLKEPGRVDVARTRLGPVATQPIEGSAIVRPRGLG
jgi:hypothetical protein